MPAPLDPAARAAIVADLRAGTALSRNALARKHGVSGATVTKIAKALEDDPVEPLQDPPFDRSRTAQATADKVVDLAARRATLAVRALDDAEQLREKMWTPYTQMIGKGDDAYPVELMPSPRDLKELAIAFGVMVDKSRALSGETDNPVEQAAGAVTSLLAGLRVQRDTEAAAS